MLVPYSFSVFIVSPNRNPPTRKSNPPNTDAISIHTSMARAKFRLFTFLQPPHAHIINRIRLMSGSIIRNRMPM